MLALSLLLSFGSPFIFKFCNAISPDANVSEMLYKLIHTVGYIIMLLLPIILYSCFDKEYTIKKIPMRLKYSDHIVLLIFGGVALNIVASYINTSLVSLLGGSSVSGGGEWAKFTPVGIAVEFLRLTLVPAFFEELFFRGFLVERFSRFGKLRAILISSLVFSLAHLNAGQIFYTFILGLFLGYMAFESGSIWGCIALHFFNNAYHCINDILLSVYPNSIGIGIASLIRLCILIVGAFCLIYYFARFGKWNIQKRWLLDANDEVSQGYGVIGYLCGENILYIVTCIFMTVMNYVL